MVVKYKPRDFPHGRLPAGLLESGPRLGPELADGFISASREREDVQGLCHAACHPEWISDPRFTPTFTTGGGTGAVLVDSREVMVHQPNAPRNAAFDAAGSPGSPYCTVQEVLADPAASRIVAALWRRFPTAGGTFKVVSPPFQNVRRPDSGCSVCAFAGAAHP